MRNAPELSPRQKALVSAALVAGALGLAACHGESTTPDITPEENPSQESVSPELNLYNNLNPEGIEQLCLDARKLYLRNLGIDEDSRTGGSFQIACLEILPGLNHPTTCSTEENANNVGYKLVQGSFNKAGLGKQALHAQSRNITRQLQKKAWDACNIPEFVNH